MKNNHLKYDLDTYYHRIRKLMVCKNRDKKKLIAELEGNIDAFLEDHPGASFDDITGHFGTPEDIAIDYISSVEGSELGNGLNKARFVKRLSLVVGLVIVLIFSLMCVFCYLKNVESAEGFAGFDVEKGITTKNK